MNFIVSSTTLLKHLQLISGVLQSSTTLPILEDFLFELGKNELTVHATDLEITMSTKIAGVESKTSGSITIPAKLIIDILKTFPEQPLSFNVNSENNSVEISSDYGKYKVTGHDAAEFPKIPKIEKGNSFTVDSSILHRAISKTTFAAANDDIRPVMSGVLFQLSGDNVTFVATDSHKLVRFTRTDIKPGNDASFIMPKKPLKLLQNIFASNDAPVQVEYNNTNAYFQTENITLICRLIDGKYPNYVAVIPFDNPNKMVISKQALISSLKRVAVFASASTNQIKFSISGSELQISAEDLDYSNSANERLTCSYDGEDLVIAFNSKFLIEILNGIDTEDISVEMSMPNRPVIILPSKEASDPDEDMLMLVMPVLVNA